MRPALVCSLHGVALTLSLGACTPAPFDVLLRGGRVLDGTGAPATVADVGIRDGRIVEIGDLGTRTAADTVDATGQVVAPGFIDPHTRGREKLRDIPTADNLIRQGITTIVDGNDGSSPLPVGAFLDSLAQWDVAPNVALLVGHGGVRRQVMGTASRPATPDELAAMEALVRQAMAEGAVGLSSGLFYVPGSFAPTEELVALARVAYAVGGIYSSHMRNEDDSVLAAVTETIRIGRETGIPVLISHHKVGGRRNYGRTVQSLALMREARDAGRGTRDAGRGGNGGLRPVPLHRISHQHREHHSGVGARRGRARGEPGPRGDAPAHARRDAGVRDDAPFQRPVEDPARPLRLRRRAGRAHAG